MDTTTLYVAMAFFACGIFTQITDIVMDEESLTILATVFNVCGAVFLVVGASA